MIRWPSGLAGALLGALVPEPERGQIVRRLGGDAPLASMVLGIVEFIGGIGWLYDNGLAALTVLSEELATQFMAEASRRPMSPEETLGLTWGGAVLWLFWLMRPTTWALISVPVVGMVRVVSFQTQREAVAEPAVWALLRFARLVRRQVERVRERRAFGPADTPDELVRRGDSELLVYTVRPRPDWNDAVTLEIGGRHYRLDRLDEVERPAGRRYRYRLLEAGEHDLIRRLVRYELPGPDERSADDEPT